MCYTLFALYKPPPVNQPFLSSSSMYTYRGVPLLLCVLRVSVYLCCVWYVAYEYNVYCFTYYFTVFRIILLSLLYNYTVYNYTYNI